ncbi:methyltransferase-like protein 27 isoform X3 [Ptychodera flava]|uniref:methyltransferase-like protein 27 isoform X3 n=1 Tax=Ptychodera flava TaxID=63121 RepID=UPI003969E416
MCTKQSSMDSHLHHTISQARDPAATPDSLKNLYDKWSISYDKDFSDCYNGPKYAAEAINKVVSDKHARILDCGCGTGLVGEQLRAMGYDNIDGVDMSEDSLQIAREKGIYSKLLAEEMGAHPMDGVQKDLYDAIICCGVFVSGHVTDVVLHEWTRVVKPGGFIVIAVNEKYIHLVKGDTFKKLMETKVIEVTDDLYLPAFVVIGDKNASGCFVITMKIL